MYRHSTKTVVKEVVNLEVSTIVFEEVGGDTNLEEAQNKFQGYWNILYSCLCGGYVGIHSMVIFVFCVV